MSDRLEEARREAERRLEQSRREAELRLAEVRTAVETEVGILPRKKYLLMALAAGAAGFALALRRKGKRRRSRKKLKEKYGAASREAALGSCGRRDRRRRSAATGRLKTMAMLSVAPVLKLTEVMETSSHPSSPSWFSCVAAVRIEAVVLAADVDDLVLPLAHSTHSFQRSIGRTGPRTRPLYPDQMDICHLRSPPDVPDGTGVQDPFQAHVNRRAPRRRPSAGRDPRRSSDSSTCRASRGASPPRPPGSRRSGWPAGRVALAAHLGAAGAGGEPAGGDVGDQVAVAVDVDHPAGDPPRLAPRRRSGQADGVRDLGAQLLRRLAAQEPGRHRRETVPAVEGLPRARAGTGPPARPTRIRARCRRMG